MWECVGGRTAEAECYRQEITSKSVTAIRLMQMQESEAEIWSFGEKRNKTKLEDLSGLTNITGHMGFLSWVCGGQDWDHAWLGSTLAPLPP